jgi:hypothetical protein
MLLSFGIGKCEAREVIAISCGSHLELEGTLEGGSNTIAARHLHLRYNDTCCA